MKPPSVMTQRGKEKVVQQMKIAKTVQRTPAAEYIGKTMVGIDVDAKGNARKLELTSQQIDRSHGTESAGINETVEVSSTLSITKKGKHLNKSIKKKTVVSDKFSKKPNLNPQHISRLIREETEDVVNTLKMVPPELVSTSVDHFPIKGKLRKLRLTSQPINLLRRSIIAPTPTADEVDPEQPPEVVASVIDAMERGVSPQAAPNQVFNTLFEDIPESTITLSSVAPGPLQDLVVPTDHSKGVVTELLTEDMENFVVSEVQLKKELPKDDICSTSKINASISTTPSGDKRIPTILEEEVPPWEDATVKSIAGIVGGNPINLLEPGDVPDELSNGVEYFVDTTTVPYETNIQIRGSKPPRWFPGYMSAFPHVPGIVKISRNPIEVLHAAWKSVQPKVFTEDSLLIA